MDDRHAELYLFGDHSDDFKVDRGGINTSNWVCPWQPSPASRVDGFVKFAGLTDRDVVVDIGCGDGRVFGCVDEIDPFLLRLLTTVPEPRNYRQCAVYDTSGVGLDISEECVACAVEMAESVGVQDRIGFVAADFCIPDDVSPTKIPLLPRATVAYVYLVPKALKLVRPLLNQMAESGVRVFTHEYHYEDWEPQAVDDQHDLRMMAVYPVVS